MDNIIARLLVIVTIFAMSPYLPANSSADAAATVVAADVPVK